jgi:hypothetical protein
MTVSTMKSNMLQTSQNTRDFRLTRREVAETCPVLRYFAESSGKFLARFLDNLSVPMLDL